MGVKIRLVLFAESEEIADRAARAAFERVAALEACLSHYREDSEISGLEKTALEHLVPVSPDLGRLLDLALELAEASGGAFDPTLRRLTRMDRHPDTSAEQRGAAWEEALGKTGWQALRWDEDRRRLHILRPGIGLDFGGIAKGFAADEVGVLLKSQGIEAYLVDAGGDLALGAAPPGTKGWKIQIGEDGPIRRLSLCGVATSGSRYRRDSGAQGDESHVLDPSTGRGIPASREVTIIAPNGALADALATTACVLGSGPELDRLLRRYDAEQAR